MSQCFRCPPEAFEEQILQASLCHTMRRNSRVQAEVATLGHGSQELLDVVVSSLHNIAPNVILAKREVSKDLHELLSLFPQNLIFSFYH